MRIDPVKRDLHKVVGLVVCEEGRDPFVVGEWGRGRVEDAPSNAVLYAQSSNDLYRAIRDSGGSARRWKHNFVSFNLHGKKVRTLRGIVESLPTERGLSELVRWSDWVRANGGNPGTFGGTAWSLWRRTLVRPVITREPALPQSSLMLGGRIERAADRGVYEAIARWDIHGAYPAAMNSLSFPSRYKEVVNASLSDDGFALADVVIPPLPWGPLPIKKRAILQFPTSYEMAGYWTLRELETAAASGCEVHIRRAWIARGTFDLFGDGWREVMEDGRSLGNAAGRLAKATANSLWGAFAISGKGETWSFSGGVLERTIDERSVHPKSISVAGRVSATVRDRLYRDALSSNVLILGCHTDGVLVEDIESFQPETGKLGSWVWKGTAWRMFFVSPQIYKFIDGRTGLTEYVFAGIPDHKRERQFDRYLSGDRELRTITRAEQIEELRKKAAASLFGPLRDRTGTIG